LILKCLEKEKEERYRSTAEVRSDLEKLEQGLPTTERTSPKTKPPTSREITVRFSLKRHMIPIAFILLALVAVLLFWSPWKRREISSVQPSRTSLAVAYFNNRLEVQDLDKNIIEMFSINLSQFDDVKVLSQQLLSDIFGSLQTDTSKQIDESTALEVARQAGADYIVAGSVFQVGENLSMTTQLIGVRDGENMAYEEVSGKSLNDIGRMVDILTERLCQELGVKIDKAEPVKIADLTTDSLEAFGHYQKGITHLFRFERADASEEFQKAITIDPEFAAAYVYLSYAQSSLTQIWSPYNNLEDSKEILAQAERFSSKIREQERMMIAVQKALYNRDIQKYKNSALEFVEKYPEDLMANFSLYFAYFCDGEFENAKSVLEKYLEINPAHAFSYNMLAGAQAFLQNHADAVSAVNKYIRLDSDIPTPYDSAWEVCMITGEYDMALDYCREVLEKFPDAYGFYLHMGQTYLHMRDPEQARSMFRKYASEGSGGIVQERWKRWYDGVVVLYEGKLADAFTEFEQKFAFEQKANRLGSMNRALQDMGKIRVYQRRYEEAVNIFERAEKLSWEREDIRHNPYPIMCQYKIGLAQIGKGDLDSAQKCLTNIKSFIQEQGFEDFYLSFAYLLEGAIRISKNNGSAALEALEKCPGNVKQGPDFTKLAAEACVLGKDFERALELYQNFKTNISMGRYGNDAFLFFRCSSLADYNLANVYEQIGNKAKAIDHYEKFLTLWKDADPALPELADAMERAAALKQH
jgi:tetratricopeptide (TPR) repeat protein